MFGDTVNTFNRRIHTHTNLLQRAELHLELLLERQQSGVLEVDEPVHILKVCPQSRLKLVFRLPAVDR